MLAERTAPRIAVNLMDFLPTPTITWRFAWRILKCILERASQLANGFGGGGDDAEVRAGGDGGGRRSPVHMIDRAKGLHSDQKRVRLPDMESAAEVCIEVLKSRSIAAGPGPVSLLPGLIRVAGVGTATGDGCGISAIEGCRIPVGMRCRDAAVRILEGFNSHVFRTGALRVDLRRIAG